MIALKTLARRIIADIARREAQAVLGTQLPDSGVVIGRLGRGEVQGGAFFAHVVREVGPQVIAQRLAHETEIGRIEPHHPYDDGRHLMLGNHLQHLPGKEVKGFDGSGVIEVRVCIVPIRINREERINAHCGPEAVLSQCLQRLQTLARGWRARLNLARQLPVDARERHLDAGQVRVHGLQILLVGHEIGAREDEVRVAVKPEDLEQFKRHAVFLVHPHKGVGHGAKAQGHAAFENSPELAGFRRFKDGGEDFPDGGNVNGKRDGWLCTKSDSLSGDFVQEGILHKKPWSENAYIPSAIAPFLTWHGECLSLVFSSPHMFQLAIQYHLFSTYTMRDGQAEFFVKWGIQILSLKAWTC